MPSDNPKIKYWPLMYYIYGSSAGLVTLALLSDCFIKPHMMFLPILITTSFLLVFLVSVFIVARVLGGISNPNEILLGCEGFFEA